MDRKYKSGTPIDSLIYLHNVLKIYLNESSKAEHHKHFKPLLNIESYLFTDLSYLEGKTLANFRCSGHNLMIEKDRHMQVEREYRFCPFCLE